MFDPDQFEEITPELLRGLLRYSPTSGKITWRHRSASLFRDKRSAAVWNARFAGKPAFTTNSHGYKSGLVLWRRFPAHRVAWAIHFGEWPKNQIDHINGDRSDNRIKNLRDVTNQENTKNGAMRSTNTSGAVGVYAHKNGRFYASITIDGKGKSLGGYGCLGAAIVARKAAERRYGFHENHGRRA